MFLFAILAHTPTWVWVLLAFLVYRGLVAMRPREVSPSRSLIVPLIFFVWGGAGLLSRSDGLALNVALFVCALLIGLAIGRALVSLSPAPRLSRATGLLAMPGSPVTLILVCVAFAVKYVGSVALALTPQAAAHAELSSLMAAAGGLFAGLFWGRTLGQFQRALQTDGQPVTLASLMDLVLARVGKDAPESVS
jgi:hypothetical protein